MTTLPPDLAAHLYAGQVIPAHPLALTADRRFDERYQRALTRYYCAAGVGGLAVGVHTTQFEIHDSQSGLLEPVLALAAETIDESLQANPRPLIKIAGLIGPTKQALAEAALANRLGYHAGLLSLAAFHQADDETILAHCRRVAEAIPLFGFYLQPAVGGRVLSYRFWRQFAEIENVVAIKIAPFNRYHTLNVVRAVVESGRADQIALYTGNDDNIVPDLLTEFSFTPEQMPIRIVGGLLGHWAVWAREAVAMLATIKAQRAVDQLDLAYWLRYGVQVTDANAAFFDAAHQFKGCIAGLHEVLRRQGLMQGTWCFNPAETLSPGQLEEIDRVYHAYPHFNDDAFIVEHRDDWLR